MSLEFDPAKDAANRAKHAMSLTEGDGVLHDPLALTVEDTSAWNEPRWVTIGTNLFGAIRVVVWSARGSDARLISVRKPVSKERKAYEEGI